MNNEQIFQLGRALLDVLRPNLERSEPLRQALGLLASWVTSEVARIEGEAQAHPQPSTPDVTPSQAASTSQSAASQVASQPAGTNVYPVDAGPPMVPSSATIIRGAPVGGLPQSSALVPLRIGDTVAYVPAVGTTQELGRLRQTARRADDDAGAGPASSEGRDLDLALVVKRCRLKAASCRLGVQRRAVNQDPLGNTAMSPASPSPSQAPSLAPSLAQVQTQMFAMLDAAKAMESCFLWAFWPEREPPADDVFIQCAECYEALAEAAALVQRLESANGHAARADLGEAFQHLATASSALRSALRRTWLTRDDIDQTGVHQWLRYSTQARQVYIERHMRLDDAADPADISRVRAAIGALAAHLDEADAHSKRIKAMLDKIRYHARLVLSADAAEREMHWAKIKAAFESAVAIGLRSTDQRLAQALGAAVELCPPDLAETLRLARPDSAIDEDDDDNQPDRGWSNDVLRLRDILRGKQIVIIGGERRRAAIDRLTEAFSVSGVEWIDLIEHGPAGAMHAPIRRPQTALVLVIIKLTGHLHAEEARRSAAEADKPCVYLTGGYNPERVAHEAIAQASQRLFRDVADVPES